MGFWSRLLGRNEYDSTVTNAQAASQAEREAIVAAAPVTPGTPGSFLLTVEDVFSITGRGVVATGQVTSGTVTVGDAVVIDSPGAAAVSATVTGIEAFRKTLTSASAGENVGLLLDGIARDQVERGSTISR
ncbi:MAG: EF-Tu/IF-2/RF-3 family GTPase [Rhodoglobus sp.]